MGNYNIKLTCEELFDLCMIVAGAEHDATTEDEREKAKHLLYVITDQEVKQEIEHAEREAL